MDKINDVDTLDKMISKVVRERSSKRNFLPDVVSIDIVKEIIRSFSLWVAKDQENTHGFLFRNFVFFGDTGAY